MKILDRQQFSLNPRAGTARPNKVQSGRYNSASEVVREALRLMEQKDELRAVQLRELRSRVDKGFDEAERGESADGETFLRGLVEDLDTRESKRKAG